MSGNYSPGEPADTALVEAARRGDLLAWERLVRRYQEAIYRVCWLVVRDSDLAQAATLSTFVRAYRALPALGQELGLLPWLIRIAAGESRQQRRESGRPRRSDRPVERRRAPHLPASPVPGLAGTTEMSPLERQTVAEAFDRLGEEDRLVLAARYLFGLDREQAANALSVPLGLLDQRLAGATKRLRTRLTVGS